MMMRNLPEKVREEDIDAMFSYADKDGDGKLSYSEFQVMINPPAPLDLPGPDLPELMKSKSEGKTEIREKRPRRREVGIAEIEKPEDRKVPLEPSDPGDPLPLSLENIKLHDKITKNLSLKK